MEGEREYSPPFWPQPQRRPSPSFSSGLRPWVLVLLSSIFIILFLPAFLSSSSSRGLRPGNLIRNGWDTLNLCLVLFAILCGLLGRSNGDEADKSPRSAEWPAVDYSAPPSVQNGYGDPAVTPTAGIRRMRSSSSYPDLRQEAVDAWGGAAEAWRFSDDIQLYHRARRSEVEAKTIPLGTGEGWRFSDDVQLHHRGRRSENNHGEWERTPEGESKTIPVDTFVLRKSPPRSRSPPPTPSPPPPPPPPPPPQRHSTVRSVHELPEKEKEQEAKIEEEKTQPHSPVPPPPPPPPPSPLPTQEQKRSQKKKSVGGAKDIATAISLFYNKKRKKGSKTKKVHDDTSPPANAPASPQSPPAPPPPPPPPSSVFYQLFSPRKGGSKSRKIHSTPPSLPPPLPPQPATLKRRSQMHASAPPPPPPPHPTDKSSKEASRLPPAPQRVNLYDKREKTNLSRFSLPPSSPLLPPPPPPPLPSDLQLLLSEEEILVDGVPGGGDGGGGGGTAGEEREGKEGVAVFCPSPDVNNKADLFIARFRAGLKLEKLNSLREKQRRQQQEEQQQEEEFMMERGVFDNDSTPS